MKVKSKQMGQYKGRWFEPGQVFEIDAEDLAHWMDPVIEEPKKEQISNNKSKKK
jgi:hypothetical protein